MNAYVGMFETEDQARKAVQTFAEQGYEEDSMLVLPSGADADALRTAEAQGFLTETRAKVADGLAKGHTALAVRVALGAGQRTIEALRDAGAAEIVEMLPRVSDHPSEALIPLLVKGRVGLRNEVPIRRTFSTGIFPGVIRGNLSGVLPLGTGPRFHPSGALPLLTGSGKPLSGLLPLVIKGAKSGWTKP